MKIVTLPGGEQVPALGQGTWYLGEDPVTRGEEIATLQRGIDLGLRLIDTAEMYGAGQSEELVGRAIDGRRDQVFLVSKVYGHNGAHADTIAACEASLKRLNTDRIDLYLLHWRDRMPLEETMNAFAQLQRDGKIRHYGVSNFTVDDMQDLWSVPHGPQVAANQLLYNLAQRGIEWDLRPWQREHGLPTMAYSPFEHGGLLADPELRAFAHERGMSPAQVALAWLLTRDDVMVIPKTGRVERMQENAAALEHPLDAEAVAEIDWLFPPPDGPQPLQTR